MTLAVMVLLAIGGGGPSLHLVEMNADRCLWGEALRMLDEVPASVQRTRAAQMVRARLLVQLERGGQAVAILTSLPVLGQNSILRQTTKQLLDRRYRPWPSGTPADQESQQGAA